MTADEKNRRRLANPLSEVEWDFASLPQLEQKLACFYEYARESKTIRRAFHQLYESGRAQSLQSVQSWQECLGENLTISHPVLLDLAVPLLVAHEIPFERPWKEVRGKLSKQIRCLRPSANKEYQGGNGLFFGRIHPSVVKRLASSVDFDAETRTERFVARLDWHVTNDALQQDFERFLTDNRPPLSPARRGKDKMSLWLSRLEWLGIMRLLYRYKLMEIEQYCPLAWKRLGPDVITHYTGRDFYRSRHRARETFHGLFPFLPTSESPRRWKPRGRTTRNK